MQSLSNSLLDVVVYSVLEVTIKCVIAYRYHHLKLYPEEDSGPMSMKKPAVRKSYDEIVFSEPSEGFLARVQNHPAVIMPRLPSGFLLPPGMFSLSFLVIK